ncbi:MAG: 4'-phosphopantetheinyl transferase superfamily protein [Lachnospiraceae bacterium]|nr:4'-phosphopantetheinyl transferase superfamily protein [Lachnospiraceae bacterium]
MKVYILDVKNISFEECKEFIEFLTPKRKERVKRYIDDKKKVISIYTELLIRKVVNEGKPIDIYYNEYGKPYLKEPKGIYFSVAHGRDKIVCVMDNEEIGIDIEYIDVFNENIVKNYFSESEHRILKVYDVIKIDNGYNKACYRIWTSKEALLKKRGTGFNKGSFKEDITKCPEYKNIISKEVDGYMISVCPSKKITELEIIEYKKA